MDKQLLLKQLSGESSRLISESFNFSEGSKERTETLVEAIRYSMAGWALTEATPENLLFITDKFRPSPNN